MNDDINATLNNEVRDIVASRREFIERHYLTVRDSYQHPYNWPELDPLRHEICLCITFGLCQAAITLTNHFLESLLKYSLYFSHAKGKELNEEEIQGRTVTAFNALFQEGIQYYGNANLDRTINHACTKRLITKEQKKQLHIFREKFRNAYGHSDKTKTFGKLTVPVTSVKIEDDNLRLDEQATPEIAASLFLQGIAQFEIAQVEAPGYFLYIDDIARQIYKKLLDIPTNP